MPKLSEILKIVCENGFSISNCAMYELSRQQSDDLIHNLALSTNDIFSTGPSVALVLAGYDTFNRLKQLILGKIKPVVISSFPNICFEMFKLSSFSFLQTEGPERESTEKCADLIFGNGVMTDAVICPNTPDDIPKVNICQSFENIIASSE